MTINHAAEILNREDHESLHWVACRFSPTISVANGHNLHGGGIDRYLTEFEAVAIAEKYEREKKS